MNEDEFALFMAIGAIATGIAGIKYYGAFAVWVIFPGIITLIAVFTGSLSPLDGGVDDEES